jgi:hypothetical protein
MRTITLICSVHTAKEKWHVEYLVKILQKLQPDVIFQEVPPLDDRRLEAQAVSEYCKINASCKPVFVDEYKAPVDALNIMRLLDAGFEDVADRSTTYQQLETERRERTCQDGFVYLNSDLFVNTSVRMEQIEDEMMEGPATEALQWFRQVTHKREIEMMRNIYSHSRKTAFGSGVFLVGAAHRTGIAKLIENFSRREPDLIAWNFYDGQIPQQQR